MEKRFRSGWRLAVRILFLGVLLALLLFVTANPLRARLAVQDWWRLQSYEPSTRIEQISRELELTTEGERIFYASQPQLLDKQRFNTQCSLREEANVLGCYNGTSNIYLLDVQAAEIEEVERVTAAHEILHGTWARMSDSEKQRVGDTLMDTFNNLNDERLNNLIQSYKDSHSGDDEALVRNELHSILATEVRELPSVLEEHYAIYFQNRGAIVDLYHNYASEFESRQERIDDIQSQLQSLKQQIEARNADFERLVAENEGLVARIRQLREQGRTEESNQLVPRQNQLVQEINQTVDEINSLIDRHNDLVKENNQLALQLSQFSESLDTKSYNSE